MISFDYPRILPFRENASKRKTLRLYMYVTAEALFSILKSGRLKLSHPWKTNDITECLAQNESELRHEIKNFGYLCFTSDCTSPAMWGYYADRGRGACLAFDFDVIEIQEGIYELVIDGAINANHPIYIRKVVYSENRSANNQCGDEFYCKSKEWEHEQEYRIVLSVDDDLIEIDEIQTSSKISVAHYLHGLMSSLSSIILGPKYESDEVEIKSYLKHCFPRIYRDYIIPQCHLEVTCTARNAGIYRAIINGSKFHFDIKCISRSVLKTRNIGKIDGFMLLLTNKIGIKVGDLRLNSALSACLNEKHPCNFYYVSFVDNLQNEETFYLVKIKSSYYLLREYKGELYLELDYDVNDLAELHGHIHQQFPNFLED